MHGAKMSNIKRFSVIYSLTGAEKDAMQKAKDICVEQTIEFPVDLVKNEYIKSNIVGRVESFKKSGKKHIAEISYLNDTAGGEFTQFLNVVFGNSSIKPGIRVEKIIPSKEIFNIVKGPRFGAAGIRGLTGVYNRPLLCSALKPMGLSVKELADMAYKFALGGIDIIKDDHGLANQPFSPFEKRVEAVCKAVKKANRETGNKTLYAPNITTDAFNTVKRAKFAKLSGAGCLIISPGLAGLETMRAIAEDASISLPLFYHPAFHGSYVVNKDSGISHYALFGQLMRLNGADAVIFPNYGGRFSFSKDECAQVAAGCRDVFGGLKPILPGPGGGMTMRRIPEIKKFYGADAVFLMGGGLFAEGPDITANCKKFRELVG
jgi:ribulose-bisphosphate carboxylase large chain